MKLVAIYLRVSTAKQDTDNQRQELEAVAARSGWDVVRPYHRHDAYQLRLHDEYGSRDIRPSPV